MAVESPALLVEESRARRSVGALCLDIIRRPTAAMLDLAAHPGYRWLWPLLALAVLSVVLTMIVGPRAMSAGLAAAQLPEGVDAEAMANVQRGTSVMVGFGAVGAALGVIIGSLLAAAVLHFAGTILGGQQGFMAVLATTAWARVPLILRSVVQILWFGTHPRDFDQKMAGLSGLLSTEAMGGESSWFEPVLAQVEIWNLWYLFLLWLAVRAFAKVTKARALMILALFVGLRIALGLVGVGIGRAFAGFGG
jgi:hypothetical protein